MGKKRAKRDHWNYTLYDNRRIVKHGISTDTDRRFIELENQGLHFKSMSIDPVPVSQATALKREKERVEQYMKSHKGRRPRYNERP